MSTPKPSAENPVKFRKLKLTAPKTTAAGIPAVISALHHIWNEMSLARGMKALAALNQKEGYDCPGCAWPDPSHRSKIAEYCENGAKAIAEEATEKVLFAPFFSTNSLTQLSQLDDYNLGKKGRIGEPLYKPSGADHYQAISWSEAYQTIARHLHALPHPDEAVFYTSGRTSNEAAFLYQLFVREFGTNNLPDCSNMCHESSGVALSESLGIGKGSVTLEDFQHSELILILGQNPGTNHPRMLTALQQAKRKGAKIIAINPLKEAGLMGFRNPQTVEGVLALNEDLADLYLQIRIGTDMALIQWICALLFQKEQYGEQVADQAFIQEKTKGFEAWANHIQQLDIASLQAITGLHEEEVSQAADLIAGSNGIIACWAMGLTQQVQAVDTIREVVNLLLYKGSIGKPGAGTCPVRGHSNVQGDRTMGIYEKPSAAFLQSLEQQFGFIPPGKYGYDVVESIYAMEKGEVGVFMAMGGNFLSATPDTARTAAALQRCKLTVQISTKLNRSHLITGEEALILPVLARSDQDVVNGKVQFISCENSMGIVHASKGILAPLSKQLKSEPVLVAELAQAVLGSKSKVNWAHLATHYDHIRDAIESCIPGFSEYNKRVREPGGFALPNGPREGIFTNSAQKALFQVAQLQLSPPEPGQLVMMTIRSHDQFNTTLYGLHDRYRGIFNERRVLMINQADIDALGFQAGDKVNLIGQEYGTRREAKGFILVPYDIPQGNCASYFPEANVLVPLEKTARKSNTPVSKHVLITLEPFREVVEV